MPEIYDIAFDFRDVPSEVDFLLNAGGEYFGHEIASSIELCCGPGYHAREMSRCGLHSDGLDLDADMVAYTNRLIAAEKLACRIFKGDMRHFEAPHKYDLAYCLMASFAQLLTNEDILRHFDCVADLLADEGIYIISAAHPRDFYGDEEASMENSWTMTRGDYSGLFPSDSSRGFFGYSAGRRIDVEELWKFVRIHDYVSGDFMRTGIDYLGEAFWPSKGAAGGVIDSCGFRKDGFYLYQSQWIE
ncbi:MAG: class I SAM-dependent methyltransferase [Acidobacteriota bacterium]